MTNNRKRKGSQWERDAVNILSNLIEKSKWKKLPTSGAMGTVLGEPLLTGDITGEVEGFPLKFKVECKVGYSASPDREIKSFIIQKEWFDKIEEESDAANAIPFVMGKFDNVRAGVKNFVAMDTKVFAEIMNYITDLTKELELVYEKSEAKSRKDA